MSIGAEGVGRTLLVAGISRESAPVRIRERASVGRDAAGGLLRRLRISATAEEAVVLSTCNRTEVYAVVGAGHTERAPRALRQALSKMSLISESELDRLGYVRFEDEAAEHLFSVVAGLGSGILGEPEIVGQARAAVALARQERMLGPLLDGLFTRSFSAGRRVRANTGITHGALSLSSVAVHLAGTLIGDLSSCSTLVIGAGKVARAVTQRLAVAGVRRIVVANRSEPGSHQLAREFGGTAAPLDTIVRELERVDLVVCATGSAGCVVSRRMLAAACERRDQPIVVLDLAVPRDVEPASGSLSSVVLRDVDYIQQIAAANLDDRRRELPQAQSIVRAEVERFRTWRDTFDAAPVVNELRRRAEQVRRREVQRVVARCPSLDQSDVERLDALTRSVVTKLLHSPTLRIRQAGATPAGRAQIEVLCELFGLASPDTRVDPVPTANISLVPPAA